MNRLNDEILNKYIDGELSSETMKEIEEIIKNSQEDRKRLLALKDTDHSLRLLRVSEVKYNFTALVMNRIQRSMRSKQEQKKFIISVISVFILMCIIIVGFVGFQTIRNIHPEAPTVLKNSIKFLTSTSEFVKNILTNKNLTIVGGIFSFGLIISAWFLFDYGKMLKKAGK